MRRKSKEQDVDAIARKFGMSAEDVKAVLVENDGKDVEHHGRQDIQGWYGLSVGGHRLCQWLIPLGVLVVSVPVAYKTARIFHGVENIGTYVMIGGVVLSILLKVLLAGLRVVCPKCRGNVVFEDVDHSAMMRYTCKSCGYQSR